MTDPRDSRSPFGVIDFLAWDNVKFKNHYLPGEANRSIALMQEAGVGFVRFDFLWEELEVAPGQFQFSKYDQLVDSLRAHGMCIEGLLVYNPPWTGKKWNEAPDVMAYTRFTRAVVDHFKDRIRHWEIWHEPDSPDFWFPQDNLHSYVKLLRNVYPVLKAVDPTSVIHLGGMSRSLPMSLKYIYQEGAKGYFDIVNIHPFANPMTPGALQAVKHMHSFIMRVLENAQDADRPIWFTEIGCPGIPSGRTIADWWLGANPDEQVQADWLSSVYEAALTWKNVEKVFWCFFRDTQNHFNSGSDYDGLLRHDFSKKPAFDAFHKLAHQKPHPVVA